MLPFFADLVMRTDEARRDFETNPVVLDAVAHGMSIERYRKLLLELYHVVWHFNPICAAAASRVPDAQRIEACCDARNLQSGLCDDVVLALLRNDPQPAVRTGR